MTPGRLDPAVISDRTSWIRTMLAGIRDLPLASFEDFTRERHHVAAAESYVRRSIEALVDLGRHILAKRFAVAVSEYKAIPPALAEVGVLREDRVQLFTRICGYRNRMVHFYHAISDRELYTLCTDYLQDVEVILTDLLAWIESNPGDGEGRRT